MVEHDVNISTKTSENGQLLNELEIILNSIINSKGLSPESIIYIVTNLMNVVGKYKSLSGIEKKELVVDLVNKAIDESVMEHQTKLTLKLIMTTVIPNGIDILVDVSKKRYKFKYLPRFYKWLKVCRCN
jgi:hypothetical protein